MSPTEAWRSDVSPGEGPRHDFPRNNERPSMVKGYRGSTSPWTTLAQGTSTSASSESEPMHSFRRTVERLSDEDRSVKLSSKNIHFDLLRDFPFLTKELVFQYAKNYAVIAPYPLLEWESFKASLEQLLETHKAARWGQVTSTLIYLAFGSAHLDGKESSTSALQSESGLLFEKAWATLPQLLLEHDLWALNGVTLMAHYLQGSSTPESCWTLLGTAVRMATSLGFHQSKVKTHSYSGLEREEGTRSWWLCYIMEKTFTVIFGRPSSIGDLAPSAPMPQLFKAYELDPTASSPELNDETIYFRRLDLEAVAFFKDMINLSNIRDSILRAAPSIMSEESGLSEPEDSERIQAISSQLTQDLFRNPRLDFVARNDANLRETISDLSYYNAVQVVGSFDQSYLNWHVSDEVVLASRTSLHIIIETKNEDGKTLCLWMWLYYAFTSVVILFLHVAHDPLHPNATADMALISDLRDLCAIFADASEGSRRLVEVSTAMDKVAFDLMKAAAKGKARKRREQDVGKMRAKHRRLDDPADIQGEGVSESHTTGQDAPEFGGSTSDQAQLAELQPGERDEREWAQFLGAAPTNFSWDEWDQWLEDIPR